MTCDYHIIEERKLVYCFIEGDPNPEEAVALAVQLSKTASGLGGNVIYDVCKIRVPLSIMPAYDFSTQLSSLIHATALSRTKFAFLYSPHGLDEHWMFLEMASQNRGLQLKVFTSENKALEWLS